MHQYPLWSNGSNSLKIIKAISHAFLQEASNRFLGKTPTPLPYKRQKMLENFMPRLYLKNRKFSPLQFILQTKIRTRKDKINKQLTLKKNKTYTVKTKRKEKPTCFSSSWVSALSVLSSSLASESESSPASSSASSSSSSTCKTGHQN